MEEILAKLLVADNSVIQQGTAELREAFKKPESTPLLCQIVLSASNPEIRQYAGVLLRKRYTKGKHWSKLPFNIRNEVKSIILPGLVNEREKFVKNAIAQLIGVIVKHELPNNTWPEIFQFIQQLVASENMQEKELGMYTLSTMTEVAPEVYLAHASSLMILLVQTFESLQKQFGNPVAFYIVKTMLHLAPLVEGNQVMVTAYNQMLPYAISTVEALTATNEEKAVEAMELFDELCDSATIFISHHVKSVIPMCLTIAKNKSLDDDLRVKAIELIGCLARTKTRAIVKHKMVEPIVDILFELLSSPPEDENDEIYFSGENEDSTPVTCATETLDLLAIHLKPEKLVPHILKHIEPSLQRGEIYAKKASFLAMAVLAEGCAEYIRSKYLEDFLRCICQGIRDQSPVVRNAALFALGQFSEYLQPEISQYSQELLPVLFEYLGQMCAHLKQEKREPPSVDRMFYALETFCENLNDALLPYLPTLMERLFETLASDSPVHIRELAISAIGASANASKEHMLPYFPRIISVLDVYLTNTHTDETMCLQVQAVDTLGVLARTIGEENFAPLVAKSLDLGVKLITTKDDPDLRKAVYGLFASLAAVTKKEMAPVLPQILEYIFNSIQSSEGIVPHFKDEENTAFPIYEDLSDKDKENGDEEDIENTDNEDDDDEDDDEIAGYSVSNAYIEEKEEAVLALREIAHHTEEAFLPYLEKSFEETFKLINYPQEDIKKASIDALTQFCINFSKINSNEGKEALLKAIGVYVPKLSELIRLDCEPTVVISGLEALSDLLKEIKEPVVAAEGHKDAVMNCVTDVFTGRIECQDQDEADGEDDEAEQDEFLIECAGDVLSYFGKAIPADEFAIYFQKALPYLRDRLNKSEAQRSFAVGIISECLSGLRHTAAAFAPQLLPLFKKRTDDPSPEVRNNAYYGIGELVYHGKEALYPHYNEILQLLAQKLQVEEHGGPRDNMTGVIARLIITNYSLVDLDRVFPAFIQQLPLKQDFEEYQSIFKSILTLYRSGHEIIKPHIQTLLKISISVLHEKRAQNEDTKALVTEFINSCQRDFPADWSTVFAELPLEIQQILSS